MKHGISLDACQAALLGGARTQIHTAAPLAPLLTVTTNNVRPGFAVDLPYGNGGTDDVAAGDVLVIQSQPNGGSFSTYLMHTITSGEIAGAPMALTGISALAEGLTNFRARLDRGGNSSAYSPTASATIDGTPPTITSANSTSVASGTQLSFTLTANETVTWSITGGVDAAQYTIASGNILEWVNNGTQSYGSPADADANNTYIVQITATDTAGNTTNQTFTTTVTAPPSGLVPRGVYDFNLGGFSVSASLSGLPIGSPSADRIVFGHILSPSGMSSSAAALTVTITPDLGSPVTATILGSGAGLSGNVIPFYAVVPTGSTMTIAWDGDHGVATNVCMVSYATMTGQAAGAAATPSASGWTSPGSFQNDPISVTTTFTSGHKCLLSGVAGTGSTASSEVVTWTNCANTNGDGFAYNINGNTQQVAQNHSATPGATTVSGSPRAFSGGQIYWIAFAP